VQGKKLRDMGSVKFLGHQQPCPYLAQRTPQTFRNRIRSGYISAGAKQEAKPGSSEIQEVVSPLIMATHTGWTQMRVRLGLSTPSRQQPNSLLIKPTRWKQRRCFRSQRGLQEREAEILEVAGQWINYRDCSIRQLPPWPHMLKARTICGIHSWFGVAFLYRRGIQSPTVC